jgi:hypothetical protein
LGILLRWRRITSEAPYDTVRVYRANSQTGTYSIIISQTIEDNSYYDTSGNSTHWYKIQFYDTVTAAVSELSDAIQGGSYYGFTTIDYIRTVTNLKTSDITDTQLATLIEFASTELNGAINLLNEDEEVEYIEETKPNTIDGTNVTFYTKNYPVGDKNNDFRVTVSDLEVYNYVNDTKTAVTVSSINAATGQFVLATAPTEGSLKVTYVNTQRRVDTPDTLIKMACTMLAASYAYGKLNIGKATRFHMGNLTVFRDTEAYLKYQTRYYQLLAIINDRSMASFVEAEDIV